MVYGAVAKKLDNFEFWLALGTELVDRLDLVLGLCSLGMSGCPSPEVKNGSRGFGKGQKLVVLKNFLAYHDVC